MTSYINELESVHYRLPNDHKAVLKVLAEHYVGQNPETPFTFRAFNRAGILQNEAGQYDINLKLRFPEAPLGYYAYACGLVWSDSERSIDLSLNCYGPTRLYFNEKLLYRSTAIDEVKLEHKVLIEVQFNKGWNSLLIKAKNTSAGFGCRIGADEAKVRILNVLSPFQERSGQAGWVYSHPVEHDGMEEGQLPDLLGREGQCGLRWLPEVQWSDNLSENCACERLFGIQPGKKAYAWSKLHVINSQGNKAMLNGSISGPIRIWMNGQELASKEEAGNYNVEISLAMGSYDVLVETACGDGSWKWNCEVTMDGKPYVFEQPHSVQGSHGAWFYLGVIDTHVHYKPSELQTLHRVFVDNTYWQLDQPQTWIRPYYENALLSNKWTTSGMTNFARWDYPLGVTMYGLLQTGRTLGRKDLIDYALRHIQACTRDYDYALWDREQYGFPAINQQLVLMKMLDNCGSFGSAMLEAYKEEPDPKFLQVAEVIADFIRNRLERREDGAFYRICAGEYSEHSMWADDLYMSTPFMRRYALITGDEAFLNDAAEQFVLYKKYLYMPEQQIMSHVYDFKYNTATHIPWGRGNGWSVFSLSEMLEVLPSMHPRRQELVTFFNELCQGYLALQGDRGLWRQVLNDPEAYEETSCTAMFTYAFSRGVYQGWLTDPDKYIHAALKGWHGLTRNSIDRHGNVYGVCSGSRYSFSADYYKEDLRTVTNDNHGIGIVMLAGVEINRLLDWMNRLPHSDALESVQTGKPVYSE